MAILKRLNLLPTHQELESLSQISGRAEILRAPSTPGAHTGWAIISTEEPRHHVKLMSYYEDVHFKFECIYMAFASAELGDTNSRLERWINEAVAVSRVALIVAATWEVATDAEDGETGVAEMSGRISQMPENSPGCVGVVGVALISKIPVYVYLEEFPLEIGVARTWDDMATIPRLGEVMDLQSVAELRIRLQREGWLDAGGNQLE